MPDSTDLPAILLLTETPLIKKSFERLLKAKFQLLHVDTAEQAWDLVQKKTAVSLLVCELKSAIDKAAIVERIRGVEDKTLSNLPVMVLVGEQNDKQSLKRAFSAGVSDFIYMPFSSDELMTRVQMHSRHFVQLHEQGAFELASQNSPVDLLNTLMQEKYFANQLEKELSHSIRHGSYLSLCLLKIDNSGTIEQNYSKSILRAVLRAMVKLLEQALRCEDIFAYFGDQTFAVMYPLTNTLGAHAATQRLVEKIQSTRMKHEGVEIGVSLSVGFYSTLPSENQTVEQVMAVLEQRLEKAQQQGGGQIVSGRTDQERNDISVEQAINMIKFNRTDTLLNQIPRLTDNLLPLLNFMHKNSQMEFNRILDEVDDED